VRILIEIIEYNNCIHEKDELTENHSAIWLAKEPGIEYLVSST
jgi:hypothetical protein